MTDCVHLRTSRISKGRICRMCGAVLDSESSASDPPALPWRMLAIGWAVGGVSVAWVPFVGFVLQYLSTLIHEMGHAAVAWSLGYPALPKFDLQHGGGITSTHQERSQLLTVLLLAAGIWLVVKNWQRGLFWRSSAIALVAVLLVLAWSGFDRDAIIAAGHLAELVICCVFLLRAATGMAVAHKVEQWLYAICGWALWWILLQFAWGLATDETALATYYEDVKGVDNDLVRLADSLGGSVPGWAWWVLSCTIIAPLVTVWQASRWGRSRVVE